MHEALKDILPIQELDMQMIQLMRLKKERQRELAKLNAIKNDLRQKAMIKEGEIIEIKKNSRVLEGEIKDIAERLKKLEGQQSQVKKVDEFNALSHEISQAERERAGKDQRLSDLQETLAAEEEMLKEFSKNLESTSESSKVLESEIKESVVRINEEGKEIKAQRDSLVKSVDQEVFRVYEMLLKNKRDRVVVPIENRCCSGCHIMLTAQHENLARKGERLVFCEHCSRIHYWQESLPEPGEEKETKRRRRRRTTQAA